MLVLHKEDFYNTVSMYYNLRSTSSSDAERSDLMQLLKQGLAEASGGENRTEVVRSGAVGSDAARGGGVDADRTCERIVWHAIGEAVFEGKRSTRGQKQEAHCH